MLLCCHPPRTSPAVAIAFSAAEPLTSHLRRVPLVQERKGALSMAGLPPEHLAAGAVIVTSSCPPFSRSDRSNHEDGW